MKNLVKRISITLLAVLTLSIASACNNQGGTSIPTTIENGGFEEGTQETWTGWTRTGTAFSSRGVVNDTQVNGITVDKEGEYWFSGLDGGTQKMTGTLTSNVFKLTGTGHIAFKMGAAKYGDKIFVEFIEDGTDTVLAKVTNSDYNEPWITDQMIRKIVDLSEHLDKNIYIKITDNDNNDDYGYVNLDDFVICLTQEDVNKYTTERNNQLEAYSEPEFEEDETLTTIQNPGFETGDLTGWKILSGTAFGGNVIVPTSQYYWTDRSVYGEGEYYLDGNNNGEIAESAVGVVRSSKFTLAGDGFISFMIGAAPTNCYIAINDGVTGEELIKVANTTFKDPALPLTLRRVYVDASAYLNKVLYITIVDNNPSSGFAFITADDFHVSMTEEEVVSLMKYQYDKIMNETYTDSYNSLLHLQNYYQNYEYPFELPALVFENKASGVVSGIKEDVNLNDFIKDVVIKYGSVDVPTAITKVVFEEETFTDGFDSFDLANEGTYVVYYGATYEGETIEDSFKIVVAGNVNVVNGGFETGDMTGWTVVEGEIDDGVIDAETYWGEKIAYNHHGNYHFDGWTATSDEPAGYVLRSNTFVLSGTGWASFMMGGNAARVRVSLADGTPIGYFTNYKFLDEGFPFLATGGRWATMTRYFVDLSAYLGEEVYVELIDDASAAGWAVAFFDEINFYHETTPDVENGFDTVLESNETGEEVQIHWEYADNAYIINGGFETGDMTGWTSEEVKVNAVISDSFYWNEKLPYNQTGNYHFDGWSSGVNENETYALRSTVFTLHGTGYISVKMGGNAAAVKVYLEDGTLVGFYKQNRFSDTNFPNLDQGGSWADMGKYFFDLSDYVGQKLYIELLDIEVEGWAVAFFDDVVTYYEELPDIDNGFDTVTLYSLDDDGEFTVERSHNIPWQLAPNLVEAE